MKQTPQMNEIQMQMQRGVITLEGFLGTDERNLSDILLSDDQLVNLHHFSHAGIAERMQHFRDAGMEGLGEFITIDGHFEVRVDSVRGTLPSPFGGPGMYAKVNTTVRNLSLGKEITYTDLHIHLVRDHGFYEGTGSRFRLEPIELATILEAEPEI